MRRVAPRRLGRQLVWSDELPSQRFGNGKDKARWKGTSLAGEDTQWRGAISGKAEAHSPKGYGHCEEAREKIRKEESWVGGL